VNEHEKWQEQQLGCVSDHCVKSFLYGWLKWAFRAAIMIITVWAAAGPLFGYSDTCQLLINTATMIVTFLMMFLIQNTQNRDAERSI
jgi:low affinity Fe/Cu permease